MAFNYNDFHKSTSAQKKVIKDDNFTYRLLLSELNKYIKPKDKILDIGCGAGTLCLYFANKGHQVLGIDISDKAVLDAKNSANVMGFKNVKFESMPFPEKFPSGKFDFIIFTEVIEHIENDELAIRKINQLLNSRGRVLVSTPTISAPLHRLGYTRGFDKRVGHLRRYSEKQIVNILEKNGFKILEKKKIEGIIRNFLFLNSIAGEFVRILNHYSLLSSLFTKIDYLTIPLFGNSNIIVIAEKK